MIFFALYLSSFEYDELLLVDMRSYTQLISWQGFVKLNPTTFHKPSIRALNINKQQPKTNLNIQHMPLWLGNSEYF